jgi:hypothetical protein
VRRAKEREWRKRAETYTEKIIQKPDTDKDTILIETQAHTHTHTHTHITKGTKKQKKKTAEGSQ